MTHTPLFEVFFLVSASPLLLLQCVPLFLRGFLWFTSPPTTCTPLFEGFFWFTGPPMMCTPLFEGFFFGFSRPTAPKMTYTPLQGVFFWFWQAYQSAAPMMMCTPLLRGFFCLIFFDNNNPSGCLCLHLEVNNFLIITPYGGF